MKINGQKPGVGTDTTIDKNKRVETAKKGASQAGRADKPEAGKSVNVELSERAKEFKKVRGLLDNVPDVRETMIIKLKADIEQGNYRVNAEKVAEKMIERAIIDSLRRDSTKP